MRTTRDLVMSLVMFATLMGCGSENDLTLIEGAKSHTLLPEVPLIDRVAQQKRAINEEAPIPPQCYTQTNGRFNPCYVCHQSYDDPRRSNRLNDGGIQGAYLFSDVGTKNQWQNLFVDKSAWVNEISDENILRYIRQDNYSALARNTENTKAYVPDLKHFAEAQDAFEANGVAKDGSAWVAFNYKPFPSTFWPTNGATDDVAIRLPLAFRTLDGVYDERIYFINLALLELNIKQMERLPIPATHEAAYKIDLNHDGQFQVVDELLERGHYVGDASHVPVVPEQYPEGTEFLHSVRYIDVKEDGSIAPSRRMKELRYMKKIRTLSEADLDNRYRRERKEKFLEELPAYVNRYEQGMENGMGWVLQAFIEDYDGELRRQNSEETFACMGCHSAIGTTIDQTFSFGRKITGQRGWGYINLKGMPDAPSISESSGEILNYLKRVGGGNEFRANPEMQEKWFDESGALLVDKVRNADVYDLITPSAERALQMNKAYTYVVRHQSYVLGRDAMMSVANNVLQEVDESVEPLEPGSRILGWDLRLNWSTLEQQNIKNASR